MSKYIIIGCGGIGAAVAKACLSSGDEVVVLNRSVKNDLPFNVESIDNLDSILDKYVPDFVIVATGMLFDDESSPEKSLSEFSLDWLNENINSNLMPSVNAAKVLSKHMTRSSKIKLMCLSARVASITDNKLGGWYSYRMSKCCLNMFVKNLSIEWARNSPDSLVFTYHPGTVATNLSEPYSKRVDPEKIFTPEKAASLLLENLHKVERSDSGSLVDWKGSILDF